MTTRQQKRAAMREKLKAAGFQVTFDHAGATCPACGYVFNNGFSRITQGGERTEERATLCTRCMRVLAVSAEGRVRLATEEETKSLEQNAAAELALLREMLALYRVDQS